MLPHSLLLAESAYSLLDDSIVEPVTGSCVISSSDLNDIFLVHCDVEAHFGSKICFNHRMKFGQEGDYKNLLLKSLEKKES